MLFQETGDGIREFRQMLCRRKEDEELIKGVQAVLPFAALAAQAI